SIVIRSNGAASALVTSRMAPRPPADSPRGSRTSMAGECSAEPRRRRVGADPAAPGIAQRYPSRPAAARRRPAAHAAAGAGPRRRRSRVLPCFERLVDPFPDAPPPRPPRGFVAFLWTATEGL